MLGYVAKPSFRRKVICLTLKQVPPLSILRQTRSRRSAGFALISALSLSACVSGPTRTDIYFGEVKPQSGTCDTPRPASLTIRGDKVQFAPTQGALLLNGILAPGGAITASLTSLDMNKRPARYTLLAQRAGDSIDGTYVTPRCRSTISLTHQ